ncbi:WD repeat-containing protein 43 [Cephus cinctus]|uniref:WD repeat-containing protein 43 n=1 Tax=Cephus cinctus TaxID=211228 RepID=A0AAJ7FRD9_CEPCN|nr:WD repeat-containing protein 43 [Cephus cinctus]
MANIGCSAFSRDGQYLAYCGNDGKLKIWETATSRLKQEYVPNLHLASPCSVLGWITTCRRPTSKKRKKRSISEDPEDKEIVAMGSLNGNVTLYDVAAGSVSKQLQYDHSGAVTALTWSETSGLFTAGHDQKLVEWNMKENCIKCKWKSGKGKITALSVLPDGKSLISADKIIKWWNLSTKQMITSFTGHATQVVSLNSIRIDNSQYAISAATGEGYLNVWSLNEEKKEKHAVATLTMQDEAVCVSVRVVDNCQIMVLAITRSGHTHLYKYQPNGHCSKPIKPSISILIASDASQKDLVQQVPVLLGQLTEDAKLLLAYGSYLNLTFEKLTPDFSDKVQCLVRSDVRKSRERREGAITKVKVPETEGNVEYLLPGTTTKPMKRNRSTASGSQLPMKTRLENLSLNEDTITSGNTLGKKEKNMVQLLMQGLHSKDDKILKSVLMIKKENLIKSTIVKLPVQEITPLLHELTTMLQGKTYPTKIAVMWLKALVATHAAQLLSHPEIGESLSPILGVVDAKITLLTELSRLKGRVSLITGQIARANEKQDKNVTEDSLLVYQEPDSSDEDTDVDEVEMGSESDENWEEISELDEEEEANEGRDVVENERLDNNSENENIENGDNDDEDDDDVSMSS